MLDALLAKEHRTMAVQAQLANTGSILVLYQRLLARELDVRHSADLVSELQLVSSVMAQLMKEQTAAAGKGIASLWVTRRQLWLSQSGLQPEDQSSLLRLLVDPAAMFGLGANAMLQQAQEARRCAREVSGALARRRRWQGAGQSPRAPAQTPGPSWGSGDLRATIEAQCSGGRGRGKQSMGAQGKKQAKPPPRS